MQVLNLKSDLLRNKLVIGILCFSMLPLWVNGYCMYFLILLAPILLRTKLYNGDSILIILFSLIYTSAHLLRGETLSPSAWIFYSLFPIIAYQSSIYLCNRLKYKQSIFIVVFLLAACLAIPAISDNILDAIESGHLINVRRLIEKSGGEHTRSATGYGMMLSLAIAGVGMMFVPAKSKLDRRIKPFIYTIGLLALFSSIHLINRTGIVLAVLSIVIACCFPPYSAKRTVYVCLIIIIISVLYVFYLENSAFMSDAVQGYISREENGYTAGSAGGRTDRWLWGLDFVFNNFLGSEGKNLEYSYAHNLIIDAGIRGGALSFLVILIIFIRYCISSYRMWRSKTNSPFERIYFLILSVVLLAQCMTEPVIEGVFQLFMFFIIFMGVMQQMNKNIAKK